MGLVLIMPALLLVTGGVLQSLFGLTRLNAGLHAAWDSSALVYLKSPPVIVGGLGLALALNVLPFVRVAAGRQQNDYVGTIRLRPSWPNLLFVALCLSFAALIFLYLLAENFQLLAQLGLA